MRSDHISESGGFTKLELAVVAAILILMILAVMGAIRWGEKERHFSLQPRADQSPSSSRRPAAGQPSLDGIHAQAVPSPAPTPPRAALR